MYRPDLPTAYREADLPHPPGWRQAMVLCHILIATTLLIAGTYLLVRARAFDLF